MSATPTTPAIAAIALGSNVGDRFRNIETALRLLERPQCFISGAEHKITVIDTSFMYESAPMYVSDQPEFINCACLIETSLSPTTLLTILKRIETAVGRVPSVRNGPRAIDLDLVMHGRQIIDTRSNPDSDDLEGELIVPHPKMADREFVLRPLNDMIPEYVHPVLGLTVQTLLQRLLSKEGSWPMSKVVPFPQHPFIPSPSAPFGVQVPPTARHWSFPLSKSHSPLASYIRNTQIMATINATPDSFSDGGAHDTIPTALAYAHAAVAAGAGIIDVGGCSTKPGADFVTEEEELRRVIEIVGALRVDLDPRMLISVDTFRVEVARQTIAAGANCVNDVCAFTGFGSYPLTPNSMGWDHMCEMKTLARETGVVVVLMHSRGAAGANRDYTQYEDGVVEGVRTELGTKVTSVVKGKGGVRRWCVVVDPGIGFSKTVEDNARLLRDADLLTAPLPNSPTANPLSGFPRLVGTSRKGFLGRILTQPDGSGYPGRETVAQERMCASAAAVACAVLKGVEIVRVHDVLEMGDVVRISELLRR